MRIEERGAHPKVIMGETMLSWVFRGLSLGWLKDPHLFRKVIQKNYSLEFSEAGLVPEWPLSVSPDLEFDNLSGLAPIFCDTYRVSTEVLGNYFGDNGLLLTTLRYRNLSCEDCLTYGFFTYRFPVWKKEWCYVTSAYCPIHLKPLKAPAALPPVERRMWDCYLYALRRGRIPVTSEEKWLAILALKAQSWIQKRTIHDSEESEALHVLYGLFLSKRTIHAAEGVAASGFGHPRRSLYRGKLDLQCRLEFGMHSADGTQRGGALLLLGWIVGLFPTKDIEGAIRGNRMIRRSLPRNPRMLGTLAARVCTTKQEGELITKMMLPLKTINSESFHEFWNGFDVAVSSLR
ncbi:hypothetical protein [Pseudomonas sp. 210_17 TE3656]